MAIDYYATIADSASELVRLDKERKRIEQEAQNHRELIVASIKMLPDDEQDKFLRILGDAIITRKVRLTDAIREALSTSDWLTASEVKARVERRGFDFSGFTTNPVSSIYSILRRDKAVDSQTGESGTAVFRLKGYGASNSLASQLVRGELAGVDAAAMSQLFGKPVALRDLAKGRAKQPK
jgi:hypothetical protein